MAYYLLKNRAESTLAAGISDADLSLTVATGEGALFPATGDFLVTICALSGSTESNIEIVKCTARSTDTLTIVRAQEGTSAVSHAQDELVELRITAGVLEDIEGKAASAAANMTDHTIIRGDGGAKGVQDTGIVVDDSDNMNMNGGTITNAGHGIADNQVLTVDSASAATGEYAKFTANGLESKSLSETATDLKDQFPQAITDNHVLTVDQADAADNEYARFTANGLESRTAAEVAADVQGSIKLDDLAAPDDNTDLDASTSKHGLLPKGTNTGKILKDDITWALLSSLIVPTAVSASSYQTTDSTSEVSLDSMSVTVTVPSTSAKVLLFFYTAASNNTAGKKTFFIFNRDGADLDYIDTGAGHAANERVPITFFYLDTGNSGSIAYSVTWKVDGGTSDVYARGLLAVVIP